MDSWGGPRSEEEYKAYYKSGFENYLKYEEQKKMSKEYEITIKVTGDILTGPNFTYLVDTSRAAYKAAKEKEKIILTHNPSGTSWLYEQFNKWQKEKDENFTIMYGGNRTGKSWFNKAWEESQERLKKEQEKMSKEYEIKFKLSDDDFGKAIIMDKVRKALEEAKEKENEIKAGDWIYDNTRGWVTKAKQSFPPHRTYDKLPPSLQDGLNEFIENIKKD